MSLDAQTAAIRAYANRHGLAVVGEFVDRGATATDDTRPEFQRMIELLLAPSNKVEAVIVIHTSRFMRDVELARRYKRELRRRGVRVLAVQQEISDDANGELMEGVYELFDQHESRIIGVRTQAAMKENARAGYFNGSIPPFGFKAERVASPSGKPKRRLIPNPEEADLVRIVFDDYLKGLGAKSIARRLNAEGKTHRGRRWCRDRVLLVLENTAAIGEYRWGRTSKRTGAQRPDAEQAIQTIEPIVERAVFDAARLLRRQRDPLAGEVRTKQSTLLLGNLVWCGKCGDTYQLETSGNRAASYRYYNCRSFCRSGREACPGFRVPTPELERAVLDHLLETFTPERCRAALAQAAEAHGALLRDRRAERARMEQERADLDKRIDRWCQRFEAGAELAELGVERLRELRQQRADLEHALAQAPLPAPVPPYLHKPAVLERFQERLRATLLGTDQPAARGCLRALVERITLTEAEVMVEAKGDGLIDLIQELGGKRGAPNQSTKVRTYVVCWRPRYDSNVRPWL